jgi:hypothetical protein
VKTLRVLLGWTIFALGLPAAFAYGLGELFMRSQRPATTENSTPPPEAIGFVFGAVVGLVVGLALVIWVMASWPRLRPHLANRFRKVV